MRLTRVLLLGLVFAIAAPLSAQPTSAEAWIVLTQTQLQQGEAGDAIDSAEEAVKLAPDDAQAHLWLGNALGMRIGQVNMLRKVTLAPSLRDAFEAAVRLDPNLLAAREALMQFYLQAPAAMGGGVEKAKAQVAETLRRNPVRGHLMQASLDRFNKDDAARNRSVDAALAAAPALPADDIDSRAALGQTLVWLERYSQARAFFLQWANDHPQAAAAHYQLGRMSAISGQYAEDGIAGLKRYLQPGWTLRPNDPSLAFAWWRLGQIQAKQGDKTTARASFEAALRLEPANAEAKKSLQAL